MSHQSDIDKIYLFTKDPNRAQTNLHYMQILISKADTKDPYEAQSNLYYLQILISKAEFAGLKHYNNSKNSIKYSNDMSNVYEQIVTRLSS